MSRPKPPSAAAPPRPGQPERGHPAPGDGLRGPGLGDPASAPVPARVASPEDLGEAAYDPVDEHDTIVSVFSGVARKGRWEPPARIRVYSLFGGADLDFCEADMLEGTTRVDVFVLFGGAQIRVPTDIDVDCRGLGIFGHFAQLSQRGDDPQPPRLLIRGTALFGGIDVKGPKRKRLRFGRRKR